MTDSNRLEKRSCSDSEERCRLLIRKIRTAIVLHDGQGCILDSNPLAQELLGLSAEQLLGKSSIDPEWHFLREDGSVLPVAEYPASLVLSSRQPLRDYVTGISRPDRDAVMWVLVNGEPEYANDGEIAQVIVSFVDITGRRRMEDALFFVAQRGWLAGAENFFDALAQYLGENLDVDYVVIDRIDENPDIAETVALYAKGAIVPNMRYALKGTPCENVMGRRLCVYPEGVQRLFPEDTLLAETGVESYIGIPLWDASGRPIGLIALMDSKPLLDTASATQLLQLVAVRAAAELARERSDRILRTREHEFRTLANNLPDNIVRYDREGRTVYVNPLLEKTLGAAAADMIGKQVREIHPDGSYEAYAEALDATLASGENGEIEFILPIPGKEPIVHQIRMIAERDEHDEVTGVLAIGHDITERKRAEEERLAHLRFIESMDQVNRAIQGTNDLEQMMSDVLDSVLSIFECDRAYLMFPCDPEAESWVIPMERTTPDYRGAKALGVDLSKDAGVAGKLRLLLSSDGPVNMGYGTPYMLSGTTAEQFSISSMMAMAVYPKVGKPWEFGIHQCSYARVWNPEEESLLKEIGRRLADGLTSLLAYRNLLESEAKYRRIVDTANEGIWMLGENLLTTYVNARMAEMIGYRTEEMIGRPLTDFILEEDTPDHLERMENRRRGLSENYERRFRHKNGQTVWTQASAVPILNSGGNFKGTFAMFTDITERKGAETKLNEQLFFLQQLLDTIPIPVFYKDRDGLYLGCNAAFEASTRMSRKDIVGKTSHEVVPTKRADMHHEADLALLRHPGIQTYEVSGIYKDGKHHDVIFNKATFVDANDCVAGIVGAQIDITERKRAEEELFRLNTELEERVESRTHDLEVKRIELEESQQALMNIVEDLNEKTEELEQANSRLQELDSLKSMFIASMSHELRTPLNSVIGFSSVLLNEWVGPVNAEQKENLAIILRSGKHLLSLINDVIDVSKIEAGKIESFSEEFDLYDLIDDAVKLIKKELEEKGLVLRVTSPSQLMFTDRRRLLQCVLNLLSNAVKFTEQGGVTVETRIERSSGATPESGFAEISVTDTGIGIREEDIGKMFQPFVRLFSPLQSTVPGTGLGLYLTRKLADEVLKGNIMLTSEYGKGSRFTLLIPVRLP